MPCSGTTRSGIQRTELNRPKQGCFAALLMHFTPTDVIARPLGRGDPCGSEKGRSLWIAASAYGLLAMTRWWADAAGFPAVHRRSVPPRSATAPRGEKLRTTPLWDAVILGRRMRRDAVFPDASLLVIYPPRSTHSGRRRPFRRRSAHH